MTLPDQFASDDLTICIIRSARRKKTVGARLVNWCTLEVRAPADIPDRELRQAIDSFVAQVRRRRQHQRQMISDQALQQRAERLNGQLLGGQTRWRSIRFVGNQRKRFGSCSPATGNVRISERLANAPDFVLDYVIVHELAHLLESNHSRAFWDLVYRYDKAERARGYLLALQLDDGSDDQSADLDDATQEGYDHHED